MSRRTLRIEWRRLESEEKILICSESGKTIFQIASEIAEELKKEGVHVSFFETRLPDEESRQSNMLLFNGIAIEKINLDPNDPAPYCGACADPTDADRYLRTVTRDGRECAAIPGSIVRQAARKAAENI